MNTIIEDEIFATVHANEININNQTDYSPYKITEINGEQYVKKPRDPLKKTPTCDKCEREFSTFSAMAKHQAKPCQIDDGESKHPIQIHFPQTQLVYIKDFLKRQNFEVHQSDDGGLYINADASGFVILERMLYFAQISLYNIEQWYDALQSKSKEIPRTAPAAFLELTDAELTLLQKIYTRKLLSGSDTKNYSRDENSILSQLERNIQNTMDSLNSTLPSKTESFFVRLSTRSPKDGAKSSNVENLKPEEKLKSKNQALKVSTPQQVVELLSRSQRIFADITNYHLYRCLGTASGTLHIILRPWLDSLPLDREFRCYIHNGRLNCISQYYCYDVFDSLQNANEVFRIRDAIMEFHDGVKDVFSFVPSYVMDVVVYEDFKIQIIELNPFGAHMSSGSALYNWRTDYDLMYGVKITEKPDIRVLKKLLD